MTDHASSITVAEDTTGIDSPLHIPPLVAGETRIRDADGFVGTVVYVGPVASAKNPHEEYAGIVWDDPSRGKHDGSVLCRSTNQVVRHFGGCGPTQGSFVRRNKLDRGVALTLELLRSKYVGLQAPVIAPNNLLPHTARTSSGRDKPIEFLGELQIRKRQQLEDIHKVSLRREGISRAFPLVPAHGKGDRKEDDDNHTSLIQNIRDVDLAGNLLSNWQEVLRIMQQFPNLTDFSVAYNRIRDIALPVTKSPPLDRIQILNLNHCGIQSFQTVVWVAKAMPLLESLCIASSDLSNIEQQSSPEGSAALDGLLLHLRLLDCSDCRLSSWTNQVEAYFGKLPLLEQLSLDDNPIPYIPMSSSKCQNKESLSSKPSSSSSSPMPGPGIFNSLRSLQLAGTKISTWIDLEGVNTAIPNLQALRLKNTPLTSSLGQGEVRFLCVARIPTLSYLNGSVVSSKERIEAERRYVTMVAHLLLNMEQQSKTSQQQQSSGESSVDGGEQPQAKDLLAEHPQYKVLLETHKGLILPSSASGMNSNGMQNNNALLASTVCNVTISSMSASSCSMEPLIRRLPGTLTVGRLKALCARAFGLDMDLMSLHFRTEADAFPVELDNDDNTLSYYGVCDGAQILMNEIDLEAQRREMERLSIERDQRIVQQEQDAIAMQEIKQRNQKHSIA